MLWLSALGLRDDPGKGEALWPLSKTGMFCTVCRSLAVRVAGGHAELTALRQQCHDAAGRLREGVVEQLCAEALGLVEELHQRAQEAQRLKCIHQTLSHDM
ncbi:hypothetical protein P4O66_005067, partial [Electrophorus voltai]